MELNKIIIKYIPNLESAINIFSKDALIYYFDDFLNNTYKSADLVNDYINNIDNTNNYSKGIKLELDQLLILNDSTKYKIIEDINTYKEMYKKHYETKEELLNDLFNNPFNFTTINSIKIDVEYLNHKLKIYCKVPNEYIESTLYQYKLSNNESLYSKLHMIPTVIQENSDLIDLLDNNFDYINDIMIRYKKDINHMTENEYNKIPEYNEKKHNPIKYTNQFKTQNIDIKFWKDDLNKYINHVLKNYTEEELIKEMQLLTEKNLNLSSIDNLFDNQSELINNIVNNNIELEDVIKNANDELKIKELHELMNILKNLLKKCSSNIEEKTEIINYIDRTDSVFKNNYKFTRELIEIIDNEDENNLEENYFEYNTNIVLIDSTIQLDDEKYKTEKYFIKELGINLELQEMIDYLNKFDVNERVPAMIFYTYYTIQLNIYNNGIEDDLMLNKECEELWYEYTEPLKIENNKLVLPKNSKSVYNYIICCFKTIISSIVMEKNNEIYKYFLIDDNITKSLTKFLINKCQKQLEKLSKTYNDIKDTWKGTDLKFYNNLITNFKKSDDNTKYIHFVKALQYITPKKLKQVNKYISGCCPQLLNENYTAFSDILNIKDKDKSWFEDMQIYLQQNIITYENEWKATTYLPLVTEIVNYESFENYVNDVDQEVESNINIDELENEIKNKINKTLSQSESNEYIQECVNNFMRYVENIKSNSYILEKFISIKCKSIYNVKNLLSIGCLNDSSWYYNIIEQLEIICCKDYNLKKRQEIICIYISAYYLSNINIDNNIIYKKIIDLNKQTLTREEYNKSINKYREELKVKAIDVLESLTTEDKTIAMYLKKNGIIQTYDDYLENKENEVKPIISNIIYKGDDENDIPLY